VSSAQAAHRDLILELSAVAPKRSSARRYDARGQSAPTETRHTFELFSGRNCRTHLVSAARLATERRACIPGRRVSSVQHGIAAMPRPINDIALAVLRSPSIGFAVTG
jgi:hypothetical protein